MFLGGSEVYGVYAPVQTVLCRLLNLEPDCEKRCFLSIGTVSPASLISGWPKKDVTEKPQQTFWWTQYCVCICAKLLQLCLALCNPTDWALQALLSMGILQAKILEWVAVPSPRWSSQLRDWTHVSYISYIGRWVPYHKCHLGSPSYCIFSN